MVYSSKGSKNKTHLRILEYLTVTAIIVKLIQKRLEIVPFTFNEYRMYRSLTFFLIKLQNAFHNILLFLRCTRIHQYS